MNTLYLVRHGENRANLTKEFSYKKVDYPLNAKGILQAQQTAEYFRSKPVQAVYSSPLRRARETAEIIADIHNLEVIILEQFREVNVGELEDRPPTAEFWEIHNSIIRDWWLNKPETSFPGGENYLMLLERMKAGLLEVVNDRSDSHIVIVGHGGIFGTLRDICVNADIRALMTSTDYHNCAISEVELSSKDGEIEGLLKRWASIDHLHGEAAILVSGYLK